VNVKRFLPIALAVAAALIAGLAVSLLLVGYTTDRNDPVGNLSPRAPLPAESGPTTTDDETTTEGTTTEGTTTEDDSGRGRGRNRGRGGDGSEDDD
jgi:hypothetical protein